MLAPAAGRLLVANPQLPDPNFDRTVVLLLGHGGDGSVGVVLNRPGSLEVADRFPAWGELVTGPGVVFEGGPVQPSALIGLVVRDAATGGAPAPDLLTQVLPDVAVVDLDHLGPEARGSGLRVFAGYAGWSPGQLQGELDAGGWWVVAARSADVATSRPETLWRDVLRRQRSALAVVSSYPPDPGLN